MLPLVHRLFPLLLCSFFAANLAYADFNPKWNKPEKPFQLADNVYYVGTNYLASYLITTPQGDILINPDFAESVPLIQQSVEALGRKFSNVKIILISHAHDDHAAGCALAKKLTGAKLMVMAEDVPVIESGGDHDFAYKSRWEPAKVDRVLHDGDQVTLGGTTLTAQLTPGHTKGCTTWTGKVNIHGQPRNMVIVGSPYVNESYRLVNNKEYPSIAADYEKMFRVLHALPCDLFLGAHGVYFDKDAKLPRLKAGGENPFVDPAGYKAFVDEAERAFQAKLSAAQSSH